YLKSEVFQRVTAAHRIKDESAGAKFEIRNPQSSSPGLWSELRFRLRRPLGILTGTIDKLLITPSVNGEGFDVEIIDFKTNRFRALSHPVPPQPQTAAASATLLPASRAVTIPAIRSQPAQAFFDFDAFPEEVSANAVAAADIA